MSKSKSKPEKKKERPESSQAKNQILVWFEKHFRLLSISLLVLASLLRLSLLLELPSMPFNQLHKVTDLDMNFFDQWGDRIANGDILTDTIWHPYHTWHDAIAKSMGFQTEQEGKQKWNQWYGGTQYHQEPLYALIIGLAKKVTGDGLLLVYVFQMLLSLASIWMIMWLGRHYFGALNGVLSGILFTFYGPGLLFDVILIRTSLSTTILLGCIVVAEQLIMGKRRAWLMGILGGAGYLLMTTTLLLWLPLVIRWLYLKHEDIRQIWKVGLAFSIFISFLIVRNSIADAPLLSSSSVGPITYVLANFPQYKPEMGFVYFTQAGNIMEETEGKMMPAVMKVISLHDSILGWIFLQFKKLGAVFFWYEIPNNVNTYLTAEFSQTLKLTFIPYSLIAALGLMGMALNLKNRKVINLQLAILSQIAVMVIFYVLCRFRVPMVAMLCVFAGYTIQQLAHFKNFKWWVLTIAGVAGLWALILRPTPAIPATFMRGELNSIFNVYYRPKLDEFLIKGDLDACANLLEEFIDTRPDYLSNTDQLQSLNTLAEKDVAYYYSLLYNDLSNVYREMGNEAKANENQTSRKNLLMASGQQ